LAVVFTICLMVVTLADQNSLNNKVIAGYQGWFETDKWRHWSRTNKKPEPPKSSTNTGLAFDLWPNVDEYHELHDTGLHLQNGSVAKLWSAQDYSTVATHTKWAHQYGIDGFFLQRFVSELHGTTLTQRNTVLENVRKAAEAEGQTFSVMYDISGTKDDTYGDIMEKDWEWIVSQGYTNSSAYQFHNGKPVVTVWGWGFSDRTQSVSRAQGVINKLKKTTTIMGGIPFYWRVGGHDAQSGWESVHASFDIISPWAVGRYGSEKGYDKLFTDVVSGDMAKIKGKQDYAPVVWPGFSWANLKDDPSKYNQIPRNCGSFMSHMATKLVNSGGPLFIYIAMFDEVNEGTAILKAAVSKNDTPKDAKFLYLDIDSCGSVPTDHYLKLAGSIYKSSETLSAV